MKIKNKECFMLNKFSIRLSDEEKETLEIKSKKLGYSSTSGFARKLIQKGLQRCEMRLAEEHILYNSVQSVLLLRELVSLFSGDENRSTQIIQGAKHSAEKWTDKFKSAIAE
jgi:predicted DNA-binding protein